MREQTTVSTCSKTLNDSSRTTTTSTAVAAAVACLALRQGVVEWNDMCTFLNKCEYKKV